MYLSAQTRRVYSTRQSKKDSSVNLRRQYAYVIEEHGVHTSVYDSPRWAGVVECCEVDPAPEMGVGGSIYHIMEQMTGSG